MSNKPIVLAFCLAVPVAHADQLLAFPGATGAGRFTPGGRGGEVLFVTNTDDAGPGSFRAACLAKGKRTILFRVSGDIELKSNLRLTEPFATIAGQSAPWGGVCVKGAAFVIDAHDVIVRHVRFRPGDIFGKELDALSVHGSDIVIDHCSTSWGIDETLSVTNADRVTVQDCFITESLNESLHKKGAHGYGCLISGAKGRVSYVRNLFAHHNSRSPRPGGKENEPGLIVDFVNNVIYGWGGRAGYTSETAVRLNYVGNYLKPGPVSKDAASHTAFSLGGPATRLYIARNIFEGFAFAPGEDALLLTSSKKGPFPPGWKIADSLESEPFDGLAGIEVLSAGEALEAVLAGAGATKPKRDAVDERIVRDVRAGTGSLINSQKDVGGWPKLEGACDVSNHDADGLPDEWEQEHGTKLSTNDANEDADGDGVTNIEEWLAERAGS